MFKSPRRAIVSAAIIAMVASASFGVSEGASQVTPQRPTTMSTHCPVTLAASGKMTHPLWVALHRDLHRHYAPALWGKVWHKLTMHSSVAYGLVLKRTHARIAAASCRPTTPVPKPIVLVSATSPSASPVGIPGAWHLIWSDGFTGSALDTTKWSTGWFGSSVTVPVNSAEQGCYDPSQVSVLGGSLNLTAINKAQTVNGTTYPYTSGLVTTMGKFTFTYGAVEARIYVPGSSGKISNWPAFWADGMGSWPTTGELDVMEGLDGFAAYHFHDPSGGPGADMPGDYTGWHTYGADWQPGKVDYYYDGKLVGSISSGITSSPMYLILNYGVDHTYGGPIATPATMRVDYVRVWK